MHKQQEKDHSSLPNSQEKNFTHSNLKSKDELHFLQIATSLLIRFLILLGQRSFRVVNRVIYFFRLARHNRTSSHLLIRLYIPLILNLINPGEIIWEIYNCFNLAVILLDVVIPMFFWIIGKIYPHLFFNEGVNELEEKNALVKSLLAKRRDLQNRQQDLLVAYLQATTDIQQLKKKLNVASELPDFPFDDERLTTAEINMIPKEKYPCHEIDNGPDMCSICIAVFKHKQNLRRLPCGHRFHVKCVDAWLNKLAACPNCKLNLEFMKGVHGNGLGSRVSQIKDTLISKLNNLLISLVMKIPLLDLFDRR